MRVLSIFCFIVTVCSNAFGITGDVAEQDMRLRLLSGSAFVDFNSANLLTPYIGSKITVCSKTYPTQCASGWIKAAGTGETYTDIIGGANPNLLNGDFESGDVTWSKGTGWAIGSGIATATGVLSGSKLLQNPLSSRSNKLYKFRFDATRTSGALNAAIGGLRPTNLTTSGTFTIYYCAPPSGGDNSVVFQSYSINYWTGTIDNVSIQDVLTPATTGVTIVSTSGGTTRNWETNTFTTASWDNAGFSYTIDVGNYAEIITGNDNTLSYGLIDCNNTTGQVGLRVLGTGNTIINYTVVRCPGGAYQFDESATLINSIGMSEGADITISSGKTVTGKNNLFSDSAKSGSGTYTDVDSHTLWSRSASDVFVDYTNGNFHLKAGSPAIDAGIVP